MVYVTVALALLLVFLAIRYQLLAVRLAVAQEQLRAQGELKESFVNLSQEALQETQGAVLADAQEGLAKQHAEVRSLMAKLEGVFTKLEGERKSEHGALRHQLDSLLSTERELRSETSNLVKALRTPLGRGRWGEIQLRRVVELAGMVRHCDFAEQMVGGEAEGRLRPDLVVKLPGGRQVVIDAKVPLEAYLESVLTHDEEVRSLRLKDHARQVGAHVATLGKKSYWDHFQPTPEFVVLFLPSEAMFSAALESDPTLIEGGVNQGVIIATPTTLIALLKAVSYGWRQESISEHAEKVRELGVQLYKRLTDMMDHWGRMGRSLGSAVEAYNKATGSLESRVLPAARKFQELGAASSTLEMPEAELIDSLAREVVAAQTPFS